jgi:methionine-rich copper-binding protein CopC
MSIPVTRLLVAGFGALVAVVAVLGLAAPAQAHNYRIDSTPSPGETLTALPPQFSVTTNDVLLNIDGNAAGFALQVRDSKGLYYGDGCVTVDGPSISTDAALGAAGKYTVTWQVISTDAHTVSDSFDFTWKPPSSFTPSVGSTTVPDCHGTLMPNAAAPPLAGGAPASAAVDGGTLATVLWIGGAVLAVGIAVVVTIFATSRKKPLPKD